MLKKIVIIISLCLCMSCAAAVQKTSPVPKGKVAVCHKGNKTLHVDESAVKAHLDHGDYLGPCR